jgi:hypothetical protein
MLSGAFQPAHGSGGAHSMPLLLRLLRHATTASKVFGGIAVHTDGCIYIENNYFVGNEVGVCFAAAQQLLASLPPTGGGVRSGHTSPRPETTLAPSAVAAVPIATWATAFHTAVAPFVPPRFLSAAYWAEAMDVASGDLDFATSTLAPLMLRTPGAPRGGGGGGSGVPSPRAVRPPAGALPAAKQAGRSAIGHPLKSPPTVSEAMEVDGGNITEAPEASLKELLRWIPASFLLRSRSIPLLRWPHGARGR